MNKKKFIQMLEQAKEDEYGRLYVLGEYNNKIYFGTITTICNDIFELNHGKRYQDTAELYDRHFWSDDTFECHVVSIMHDEDIICKEPKRIEELSIAKSMKKNYGINYLLSHQEFFIQEKINELVKISNKYARLLEKVEGDS